ncbi:titin isoform X1 [Culex quinquefasciatus]|nr:titin isoform X1 [Culex quinquefasciatus]
MAPSKTDCNKNSNSENGRNGDDESAAKKEPVRNETEDFDVSDCFTNDFDDVNGGRMIASKKNGSFVNIEASQEMPLGGGQKEETSAVEPKESKPTKKMLDAAIVIDLSDDDEVAGEDSQESLDSRFKRTMTQARLNTKKEADCENEDPDIVQLKKDLYQSNGEIDYDIDLGEDEKPIVKIEAEPKVEPKKADPPMVVIKVEPPTPVKQSKPKINPVPIPTIDLTSSDEEVELLKKEEPDAQAASPDWKSRTTHKRKAKNSASNTSVCSEYVVVKAEQDKLKIRRKKRKSKKRYKRRESSSESELVVDSFPVDLKKRSKSTDLVANSDEAKPAPDQKDVEPKVKSPAKQQSPNRRRSNESDYVKSTITKELETPADTSDQKAEEEETGPFVNTDIALEDLLNDFLEDETVPQNPSQVLFPTVSTEEDKLLNSPLIDCERILLAELDNILEDEKLPLPDKIEQPPEQPLFTYTIYEPNSAAATPLNITVSVKPPSNQKPSSPTKAPTPRFRIVYGRSKYPPPAPPPKKRPGRPARAVPEPPPKPSKSKRYESDEEYIPSFARTRRYPLRPRRARRRAPRARLVAPAPNGYFLTELQVQPEPDPEEEEEEEPPTVACQSPLAASDGVYMNMPSLAEEEQAANRAPSEKSGRKRGRAPKHHIEDYFGSSPTHDKKDETPATETASNGGGKKPQIKRRKKRSRISSGSSEYETTATESTSLAGTISTITAREGDEEQLPVAPEEVAPPKTDEMRVVLSPLTDAKIEKLSKCNTPKKQRALSKASQTELQGLSWRIDLDQIDFHSEYFEKLYQLIVNGRELRNNLRTSNNNNNKFEGVVLVGRDAVLPPTPPERSPQRPVGNGRARSVIEQLLFQRADEIEFESSAPVDPAARERMERSVRSNFRIPKIAKQPSRSPQDVTSSTQHDNEQQHYQENETRRSSSGGYSNDRHVVAPDARRPVTVGSPLRNPNRPEAAAPTIDPQPAARPVPIMRRTIRNDNVQPPPQPTVAPPTPAQPQPVENGFSTYGPPEQVPAPQQQYRASASNMFQPPQQQQQQLGGYTASGQEMDVKPNISALMNPANMLGTAMMNPSRFFDSLSMVYQVTMMQMMQQHMPFPAMNPAGQAPFPGPSVAPTAANMAQQPQPMPAQMMPPPQPTPSSSAGPRFAPDPVQSDEVSDQICQIFGCIDHLKGRCIKNPCQYSHTLPNESSLLQMLLGSAQDVVMTTYQFIVGQDSLFLRYFPVYTEVMGRRNMRHQLVDAVPHCEQSKRAFSHYRYIVDGLTINGTLTRSKAVQLVLEKHRKINFDQINVLITLMLDTGDDIPQFLQWFEQFAQVQDYHYEIPSINRLIKFCVRCSRSVDVAKLTYRLVLSVAPGKEPFVDTDALSEFVEQLMKSKLGLDLEKIRLKYRENELSCSARR